MQVLFRSAFGLAFTATMSFTLAMASWAQAPTMKQDDTAKAVHSQSLINSVDGGFQAFTGGPSGQVIHIQSGMVCVPGGEKMLLAGLMVNRTAPPGDDVGCDYVTPDGKTTVFATRAGAQTLQGLADGVGKSIKAVFPDAQPTAGPLVATMPGLNQPLAASFTATFNGKPCITSVWISEERGWLIEVRATYPIGPRHDPELLAAMLSVGAQKSISDHGEVSGNRSGW